MNVLIVFGALFCFLGGTFCLPDCIKQDLTCPLDNSRFAIPPTTLSSWEKCRDLCNSLRNCSSFTFYGSDGSPFKNVCFLFKEHCKDREMVSCNACLFGHQCNFCSVKNVAYAIDGEQLISLFTSYNESDCRETCTKTKNCLYYTIYMLGSDLMPNTCVLMSSSSEPVACRNCRTGPAACDFSAQCKPNEAVLTVAKPSTHGLFVGNGTFKVSTMGCSTKANVLLIGGGGTGGYKYSGNSLHGGGGSGYINYATVHIPFSSDFLILVGKGGLDERMRGSNSRRYQSYSYGYDDADASNQEQPNPSMAGQQTLISNEFGIVISKVDGGEAGYQTAGGNGYSGGGSAGGKSGGEDGGDGGGSSEYKGGSGSRITIHSFQHLFEHYLLVAAKGNAGSSDRYSDSYGGGGGGIQIYELIESDDVTGRNVVRDSYSYGQGGDGDDGKCAGNNGAILFEIIQNWPAEMNRS